MTTCLMCVYVCVSLGIEIFILYFKYCDAKLTCILNSYDILNNVLSFHFFLEFNF